MRLPRQVRRRIAGALPVQIRWRVADLRQRATAPKSPATFNEKLQYKMAFDRRPILTEMADKVAVRDLVERTIGPGFLTKVYAISRRPEQIDWQALPREFVCKVNHMSGGLVIVWDGASPQATLPEDPKALRRGRTRFQIRPENLDLGRLVRLLQHWLSLDYSWRPPRPVVEWAYRNIPRAVLVEELLTDSEGELPRDYKLFVFNGRVRLIQVDTARYRNHHQDLMSPDWDRLPVEYIAPRSDRAPQRPANLAAMIEAAERLGSLSDFLRVDLYSDGERIVFGELTNYPNAARAKFDPPSFDLELGRYWRIEGY